MLNTYPHPTILAHRGASTHAPENTLAAFNLAVEHGADGVELDVKLSSDGHVVVIHDPTVDRTTGARGQVKDMSLDELGELDAGSSFSGKFKNEPIPTLEDVFESLGKKVLINIELTNYNTRRDHLVESVCMLVKRFGFHKNVLFSSFLGSNLTKVRSYLPDVSSGLLALPGILGAWHRSFGFAFGKYDALHPNLQNATQQHIYFVHRLKRRIHVWTVNEEDDMRRLFKWGVDGIITDDPLLAVKVRGELV
ncbi:MAG TPA: glycerophosphodiester phosphodiesterase family protein [Anaerolineales bacterium]|nr:glycerophosphodiester phosphodiesterase family protein [Anaerolineales bacterium]